MHIKFALRLVLFLQIFMPKLAKQEQRSQLPRNRVAIFIQPTPRRCRSKASLAHIFTPFLLILSFILGRRAADGVQARFCSAFLRVSMGRRSSRVGVSEFLAAFLLLQLGLAAAQNTSPWLTLSGTLSVVDFWFVKDVFFSFFLTF